VLLGIDYSEYSDDWKQTIEVPVHRDVFGQKDNEKDLHNCYKHLLTQLVGDICPNDSLKTALIQLKTLWPPQFNHTSLSNDLSWHVIQFVTEHKDSLINIPRAAFAFFYLVYTKSYDCNFDPTKATNIVKLLESLRDISLEEMLGSCMSSDVVSAIIWVIKLANKDLTMLHFVHACYPMLSQKLCSEYLHNFQRDCPDKEFAAKAMKRLCELIGKVVATEDLIQLLLLNVSFETSFFICTYLEASGFLESSLMCHVKTNLYKTVEKEMIRYSKVNRLKDITNLAKVLEYSNSIVVNLFSETLSRRVLHILEVDGQNITSDDEVYNHIASPQLFLDATSRQDLFYFVSKSKEPFIHRLFPKLLNEKRLFIHFQFETVFSFLQMWLHEESVKTSLADCNLLHFKRLLQFSKMDVFESNTDVVENLLRRKYCDNVCSLMKTFNTTKHIMQAETFLYHFMQLDDKAIDTLCFPFEEMVIKIMNTRDAIWTKEELEKVECIARSNQLFSVKNSAEKLLNGCVNSHYREVHSLLLLVLKRNKFWKIILPTTMKDIISRWLKTAKEWHCRERAKSNKKTDSPENILPYLYEYLADIKQMPFPDGFHQIYDGLEMNVKEEWFKLDQRMQMDMMNNAKYIRQDAVDLLETHISETELNGIMSLKAVEQTLKCIGESNNFYIYNK